MARSLRYVMRVRWCFSLLNYLLRTPLYDQKSKVCTARIKWCFRLRNYLLRSPLYDQKSKVCNAPIRRCFILLNYLLRFLLYDRKSKVRTSNNVRVKCASVAHLFPALPTPYDQNSKVVMRL